MGSCMGEVSCDRFFFFASTGARTVGPPTARHLQWVGPCLVSPRAKATAQGTCKTPKGPTGKKQKNKTDFFSSLAMDFWFSIFHFFTLRILHQDSFSGISNLQLHSVTLDLHSITQHLQLVTVHQNQISQQFFLSVPFSSSGSCSVCRHPISPLRVT